jgi:hypothetical protein
MGSFRVRKRFQKYYQDDQIENEEIANERDYKWLKNVDRTPENLEADESIILKLILEAESRIHRAQNRLRLCMLCYEQCIEPSGSINGVAPRLLAPQAELSSMKSVTLQNIPRFWRACTFKGVTGFPLGFVYLYSTWIGFSFYVP